MSFDPLTAAAEARLGQVLSGKWRLDHLLGVGGTAAVYEATHRNGRRVAVKVLHAEHSNNEPIRARFLAEGYAANAVRHEGVVSVLDDDTTADGAVFLVMDLLEGETLDARWMRHGRHLPPEEVLAIAAAVLEILVAAHAAGILHRDIKPENLFLTRDGSVKLLDFGIARVRELSASGNRTAVGFLLGTPSFMPPEQARGLWHEVDARSDVWAVGALMFTLLAGRYVHDGNTANQILLAAMTQRAPALAGAWPEAPPGLAAIVDGALAFDQQARWPDAASMLAAIREGASWRPSGCGPSTTTCASPPSFESGPAQAHTRWPADVSLPWPIGRSRLRLALVAGAVMIAVATLSGLGAFAGGPRAASRSTPAATAAGDTPKAVEPSFELPAVQTARQVSAARPPGAASGPGVHRVSAFVPGSAVVPIIRPSPSPHPAIDPLSSRR